MKRLMTGVLAVGLVTLAATARGQAPAPARDAYITAKAVKLDDEPTQPAGTKCVKIEGNYDCGNAGFGTGDRTVLKIDVYWERITRGPKPGCYNSVQLEHESITLLANPTKGSYATTKRVNLTTPPPANTFSRVAVYLHASGSANSVARTFVDITDPANP